MSKHTKGPELDPKDTAFPLRAISAAMSHAAGELHKINGSHDPRLALAAQFGAAKAVEIMLKAFGGEPARIVACVNACEGIADPSVVPELVDRLRMALEMAEGGPRFGANLRLIRETLARAEGRK